MALLKQIDLYEHTQWNPPLTYQLGTTPLSIAGFTFEMKLLDKKGGTILLDVPVTNNEDAGGNVGELQPQITKAQNEAFRKAEVLPKFAELYVISSSGEEPYLWMEIPVEYHLGYNGS
jgi:hypothetical protein